MIYLAPPCTSKRRGSKSVDEGNKCLTFCILLYIDMFCVGDEVGYKGALGYLKQDLRKAKITMFKLPLDAAGVTDLARMEENYARA